MPWSNNQRLCKSRCRRSKLPCTQPAVKTSPYQFCRMHFGKKIGPQTPEGHIKRAQASMKHGNYSQAAKQEKRMLKEMVDWGKEAREL